MIYLLDTNTVSQWMSPQPGPIQDQVDAVTHLTQKPSSPGPFSLMAKGSKSSNCI